jgi:MFS family permease
VPVREEPPEATAPKESVFDTARRFLKVWREDREFRRFESFFVVFGFANIMSIPLTQIHAVDVLKADYFDLALINIVLMQGFMVLTLVWWGKLVDRYPPARIRGLLNVIFAVDFLMFAIAPTIEWVYAGRIFRGIAISGGSLVWMLGPLYYARSEKEVPVYLGIHSFLTGLRWLVAPFAGVWLKELCGHNARPIFWVSFAAIAATGLLMLRDKSPPDSGRGVKESTMPAPRTTGS